MRERKFSEAVRYFRESFERHPNPKALLMRVISGLR
jgi:hypothetical protein